MDYTDAIKWLKENNVTKDDGTFYEFGDVSGLLSFVFFFDSHKKCELL